jgi:hypothetical protein
VRQLENLCHWLTVMAPGQVNVEVADLPPELRGETGQCRAELAPGARARGRASLIGRGEHGIIDQLSRRVRAHADRQGAAHTGGRRIEAATCSAWDATRITRKIQELGIEVVPKDGPPPDRTGSSGNPEVDFKGQKRSNDTHASTTDPDARLMRKSNTGEAIPAYIGNVLMENRSKLAVDTRVALGSGSAEREAAIEMLGALPGEHRKTVGADKGFDTKGFVAACREINVTAHVAQNSWRYTTKTGKSFLRPSAIDQRTTRHAGYELSQVARKVIETLFGDGKQHGGTIRQVKLRGLNKVKDLFTISMLAANLRRLPRLLAICPSG